MVVCGIPQSTLLVSSVVPWWNVWPLHAPYSAPASPTLPLYLPSSQPHSPYPPFTPHTDSIVQAWWPVTHIRRYDGAVCMSDISYGSSPLSPAKRLVHTIIRIWWKFPFIPQYSLGVSTLVSTHVYLSLCTLMRVCMDAVWPCPLPEKPDRASVSSGRLPELVSVSHSVVCDRLCVCGVGLLWQTPQLYTPT